MRALLLVLDSLGVGHAPDAADYGDEGANTLGHILEKKPDLRLPALNSLGIDQILRRDQKNRHARREAAFGRMRQKSVGKDTTTGHWEIAGVILDEPFEVFEKFPRKLIKAIENEAQVQFIGNYAESGTKIIQELGYDHLQTHKPILYTSADSVMQIAAHEEAVPLQRLYEICRVARRHCDKFRIGRVIARPFVGSDGSFQRTANRHDYSMVPPRTVLNAITETGLVVEGIGKISDIFAGSGVTRSHPTKNNREGMAAIDSVWQSIHDGLIFTNLVDFDMHYGHRRNVDGYAQALEDFDVWLETFLKRVDSDDLLIITADHGNDPTFHGTDHTREEVPLMLKHRDHRGSLGVRETFADVAATLSVYFKLPNQWPVGTPVI